MTPFSKKLRAIRNKRGLLQKNMADILGYEQSYLSALETSLKAPPHYSNLKKLIEKLQLTEAEAVELEQAAKESKLVFKISPKTRPEVMRICHQLENQSLTMTEDQIQIITSALNFGQERLTEKMEANQM